MARTMLLIGDDEYALLLQYASLLLGYPAFLELRIDCLLPCSSLRYRDVQFLPSFSYLPIIPSNLLSKVSIRKKIFGYKNT